jgi:hypothetical protein
VTGIPDSTRTALDGLRALGGDGLVQQMVSIFIDHSAGRIAALQSALDAGDLHGGGGGAQLNPSTLFSGGSGGSGVVIVRYPDVFAAAASTTGSPAITVAGGFRVYTWTGSGSITF